MLWLPALQPPLLAADRSPWRFNAHGAGCSIALAISPGKRLPLHHHRRIASPSNRPQPVLQHHEIDPSSTIPANCSSQIGASRIPLAGRRLSTCCAFPSKRLPGFRRPEIQWHRAPSLPVSQCHPARCPRHPASPCQPLRWPLMLWLDSVPSTTSPRRRQGILPATTRCVGKGNDQAYRLLVQRPTESGVSSGAIEYTSTALVYRRDAKGG